MDTIKDFKAVLDAFFTKAHCNNALKEETDFQEKLAKYLVENKYAVLREVTITEDEVPAIREELDQNRIEIDIVAFKSNNFFPVELKFENKNSQTRHVSKDLYDKDWKKMGIVYKHFADVPVARTRILTNNKALRDSIANDDDWCELSDGKRGDNEFMYQWHWWHDQTRDPKASFKDIWNRTVQERKEKNEYYAEDTLFSVDAILQEDYIRLFGDRLSQIK